MRNSCPTVTFLPVLRHKFIRLEKPMNSEKEFINQIRTLREIKPDADWVFLNKARILGQGEIGHKQPFFSLVLNFVFQYRAMVAGLLIAGLAGGTVAASQNALPGQPLYSLKKATERGLAIVAGQDKNPAANLLLAAKRLEEIDVISQKNLLKNLPAAFYEYKTAKAAAKKEVASMVKQNPANAGAIVKEAGLAMKDINEKEKQVYGVLGLEQSSTSTSDVSEAASDQEIVGSLIDYFKKGAVLSEEQINDLAQVKKLYDENNYGQAIDYYLNSSLNE